MSSAKALLLTILGEYVLPNGGAIWTRTAITALGTLDVDERNARQALGRIADQGFILAERVGRRTRWHLTTEGHTLLTSGTQRIYGFGERADDWDHHWIVVFCSVPEDQRGKRHRLRSQLAFAGFGFLAQGIALSPHLDREALVNTVLTDLDLLASAVVLRAEAGELVPAAELLHRAWDLDALAERYGAFVATFARRSPRTAQPRFTALTELVHEWRGFPFVDPEIPDRLLPRAWPGRKAKVVFDTRHAQWAADANDWFLELEASND